MPKLLRKILSIFDFKLVYCTHILMSRPFLKLPNLSIVSQFLENVMFIRLCMGDPAGSTYNVKPYKIYILELLYPNCYLPLKEENI